MRKLIFIPLLFFTLLCNAQFTKSGGTFLKSGNVFLSAPAEPAAPSTLLNRLEAYYKLDEASGTVLDAVGDNDGTNVGATPNQTGILGTAYVFSAADSILMGDTEDLSTPTDSGTISVWVYSTGSEVYGMIASKLNFDTDRNGYGFWVGSGMYPRGGGASASTYHYTTAGEVQITTNEWHLLVMTWDNVAGEINIYVDDEDPVTTSSFSLTCNSGIENFHLGSNSHYGSSFVGTIDEVGIWSRAITSDEVEELYNGGTGKSHPF